MINNIFLNSSDIYLEKDGKRIAEVQSYESRNINGAYHIKLKKEGRFNMERLTTKSANGRPILKKMPPYEEYEPVRRLAAIEDILGDDYNLDHLQELVEADRDKISPCTFCWFNPPSSSDGKLCCMCPATSLSPEGEEDT